MATGVHTGQCAIWVEGFRESLPACYKARLSTWMTTVPRASLTQRVRVASPTWSRWVKSRVWRYGHGSMVHCRITSTLYIDVTNFAKASCLLCVYQKIVGYTILFKASCLTALLQNVSNVIYGYGSRPTMHQ